MPVKEWIPELPAFDEIRKGAPVVDEPDDVARMAEEARSAAAATVRRLARERDLREDEERRQVVQRLLDAVPPDAVDHPPLRTIERHGLSIRRGLSFRSIMIQRSEASRHAGVKDRGWWLDEKLAGFRFADKLGVRRPAAELEPLTLSELEPTPPLVIKPARSTGARGVFLVHSADRIIDVRAKEVLSSWEDMLERMRALMSAAVRPLADRWVTEELIIDEHGDPARDLKFFCFYGKALFVQEIERLPRFRATFWGTDGQPVDTGKPSLLTEGYGITDKHIAVAESISAEIPHPFMRIDTLRAGPDELVVGEFTPRPGQFEEFDRATDRWMGEEWVRAERRIMDDALDGKRFAAFFEATGRRRGRPATSA